MTALPAATEVVCAMGGHGSDKEHTLEKSPYLKCNQCEFVFDGGSNLKSQSKRDQQKEVG